MSAKPPETPGQIFVSTLVHGAVYVLVALGGFGLARYLQVGKTFDAGSWIVIGALAVLAVVIATVRAVLAQRRSAPH